MKSYEIKNNLKEVRAEISRINNAAGRTVFNPSATDALEEVIQWSECCDDMGITELLNMREG